MSDDKNKGSNTAHVEGHHDTKSQTIISDDDVASDRNPKTLDSEELHAQMTAQVKATRLSWRPKASLQLWAMLFVAYCNSWGTGFDSSLMGAMNANDRWHEDLNVPKSSSRLGIVTAIYSIGQLVGSFAAGPAADRWGRRWGMFIGATIVIVGAIIMTTSNVIGPYMFGRFLTGVGNAIVRSAAPSFVAEITPPRWRGPATLLYNSLWLIGAIISNSVAYGTGPIADSRSWRIPLSLQVVPSSVVVLACLFLPESPRWLIANDRQEEAKRILVKYHAAGDENHPIVALEMAEMRLSIRQEASDKRWYDYSELVSSRSNRYRTFLVVSIACIGQWGGNNLTSYYLADVLESIGITGQNRKLVFNLAYFVAALGGATTGSLICNRVGRRPLLIFGCLSMTVVLIGLTTCTALYDPNQSASVSNLTIAFIFFVGIFHSAGVNPLVVAYPVECLHTNIRAKGMGLNNFGLNVAEFVNNYGTPVGLKRIKWRIYIIYLVWNVVMAAWVYFFFVETRGHTLEELDAIFEDPHPVKRSLRKVNHMDADEEEHTKN